MHCHHLSLTNFRNYVGLELDLPPHPVVIEGNNAQGKTNLLEALYLLATTRSHRNATDRELISWFAPRDRPLFVRLGAEVQRAGGRIRVEIVLRGEAPQPLAEAKPWPSSLQKRMLVNGVVRRAIDIIGQIRVVMFTARDIDLVGGAPALRRRYLDVTNSQVDPHYLRALQRYNRVLLHRNHLLRLIGDRRAEPEQLTFWDNELVQAGSYLIVQRQRTLAAINDLARNTHHQLTNGEERMEIIYQSSVAKDGRESPNDLQLKAVGEAFRDALAHCQSREIAQGMSLVGPHRDDLRFLVNGVDMAVYGSRGQQRTIAISLKLAEAGFMLGKTNDSPILLLDDVFSELDTERRCQLLERISNYQQVLITATDLDRFEPDFLAQAMQLRVSKGTVEAIP